MIGSFSLHEKEKAMRVPAKVTYLPESELTKSKMPGDLLAGRASIRVSLEDSGIKGFDGVVGSKVSETIDLEVSFTASSKVSEAAATKPCNPCGGKKKSRA